VRRGDLDSDMAAWTVKTGHVRNIDYKNKEPIKNSYNIQPFFSAESQRSTPEMQLLL